jgi:hypothetical protein
MQFVTDVNGDGKMDVIAAGGDSVRVMLGDGRGGFAMGPTMPAGQGTWRLDKADLNGDGKMDLVTSNSESGTVECCWGGELPDVVWFTCFRRDLNYPTTFVVIGIFHPPEDRL